MSDRRPVASVIVPTYREAPNLTELIERVFTAAESRGCPVEMIVVDDDSNDGTDRVIEAMTPRFPVRLVVRRGQRGLSGAVLEGFAYAGSDRFVVMDADLQHPPELIPDLLERLSRPGCDFVLASRYEGSASIAGRWPRHRRLASRLATLLARPLAPVSDPMSGFFALHRRVWERAGTVRPRGFKIALELFVRGRCRHPECVPMKFDARHAGESKLGRRQQWQYLVQIARLYAFRFPLMVFGVTITFILALVVILVRNLA